MSDETKQAHTPGPWETSRATHGTWIKSESVKATWAERTHTRAHPPAGTSTHLGGQWAGHVVCIPDHIEQNGIHCGSIAGQDKTQEEIDANAHLIAAAPELLAALRAARDLLASLPPDLLELETMAAIDTAHEIDAAIDKAEGGAS